VNLAKLDPRVKLLILIGFSTTAVFARSVLVLLSLFALTMLILLIGGVKPGTVWIRLRFVFGLLVMLFLLQSLFNRSGEPLLVLNTLTLVTDSGFRTAVTVCLRLLVIVLSALIVLTGETRDYLLAFTQCKIPYEIAFMVLAALRFLPILKEEAHDILNAAQMRGMQTRGKKISLKNQAAAYISIVIPVVASAIRRAEQLSIAMEARGFRAHPRRVSMRKLQMRTTDWLYLVAFCTALTAVLFLLQSR
jgi:energy-coupling factor transport system permease protein